MAVSASAASASVVVEEEPNDTLATAQNLDGLFTTGSDANVTNAATVPYVTVLSTVGENSYDYYSFHVAAGGSSGTFDIDGGSPGFDPWLTLLDSGGNVLVSQDDSGYVDFGSATIRDPFFTYNFANAGLYYLKVGSWPGDVPTTGPYKLNVSLQSPGVGAVPEPSTWALMLLGFGAIGAAMRRRPKQPKLAQIA